MTLPLMALLFMPIALDMRAIYPWVEHAEASHVPEGGLPHVDSSLPDATAEAANARQQVILPRD